MLKERFFRFAGRTFSGNPAFIQCRKMRAIFLMICCVVGLAASGQLTYETLSIGYDSAIEYRNLRIIPVIKKDPGGGQQFLSLGKALQQGIVTVSERGTASTENVHWLRINNKSRKPLFISAGEVILGGRQDRMVTRDTVLVPTGGDQYISVMCVEEDRWSEKEKKFAYFNYANPRLRRVVNQSANQVLIWREIFNQLDSNKIKAPTLSYASQRSDKKMTSMQEEYMRYFSNRISKSDSGWVGFICMSGDRIIGADIFDNPSLFYDQLYPLLQGYVEDAIITGSPSHVTDEKVKQYMDPVLRDEQSQLQHLKTKGKLYRYEGKVIHITVYGE
jgi:hypothetical protein